MTLDLAALRALIAARGECAGPLTTFKHGADESLTHVSIVCRDNWDDVIRWLDAMVNQVPALLDRCERAEAALNRVSAQSFNPTLYKSSDDTTRELHEIHTRDIARLCAEKYAAEQRADALNRTLDDDREYMAAAHADILRLNAERDEAREQLKRAEAERDEARKQNELLMQLAASDHAYRMHKLEQLDAAHAERDALRSQLERAEAERDNWQQQVEMDHRGVLVDKMIAERAKVTAERDALRAECERLRASVCCAEPHTCDQEAIAAAEGRTDRAIIERDAYRSMLCDILAAHLLPVDGLICKKARELLKNGPSDAARKEPT
jgi:chromosome segregation ATPase